MPLLADRTAHESTATGAISHTCGITSAVGQQASPLLRHNFVYSCGIIRVTHCRLGSRGRGHREAQRAEAGPRPSTRIAPSRTPHTDPDPPYQSTPAATTSAPHPQPRRTPGPRPRSTAQPRTRTPAPTMDETGASPEPLAAQQQKQAQSTANANGKAERFIRTLLAGWAYAALYQNSADRTAGLDGWLWYYNYQRLHSALDYRTPVEVEAEMVRPHPASTAITAVKGRALATGLHAE